MSKNFWWLLTCRQSWRYGMPQQLKCKQCVCTFLLHRQIVEGCQARSVEKKRKECCSGRSGDSRGCRSSGRRELEKGNGKSLKITLMIRRVQFFTDVSNRRGRSKRNIRTSQWIGIFQVGNSSQQLSFFE